MIYISLPYATFGLIHNDFWITIAPPIAKWTIGKDINYILAYYKKKGAIVIEMGC